MKQLFTLSAAFLCSIGAYAQAQKSVNPVLPKQVKVNPGTPTHDKTTSADSRLIAVAELTYGSSAFEIDDSTVLSYTGNNGWDYATEGWKFDTGTVWTYDASTMSWNDDGGIKQTLTNNRIMNSVFKQRTGSVWQEESKSIYTYNNGLLASEEYYGDNGSGIEPMFRSSNIYNADKQITEAISESWNSSLSQWENSSRTVNHYNSAGLNDTVWTYSWTSGQWNPQMRNINTYANGQLTNTLQQTWNMSAWQDAYRNSRTYDSKGDPIVVESEQWNFGTSSWEGSSKTENTFDNAHNLIEDKHAYWNMGSYLYSNKTNYTHNQFNRVLTEVTQTYAPGSGQWIYDSGNDYLTRNYYEPYTNDVKTVTSNIAQLNIHPVPAKEQITVSASFKQAQPVTITVRDMSGRVVKQLADQAGAQFRKTINVADMPAGNYLININGTTEVASKMITIAN